MKVRTIIVPLLLTATLANGCASLDERYDGSNRRSRPTRSNEGYYGIIASIESGSVGNGSAPVVGAVGEASPNHEIGSANGWQDVYFIRIRFDDRSYETVTQASLGGLHVGDSVRIERSLVRRY